MKQKGKQSKMAYVGRPFRIRLKDFMEDSVILDPGSNIDFYIIREKTVIKALLIWDQILIRT